MVISPEASRISHAPTPIGQMVYHHVEIHGGPNAGSFDCKEPLEIDLSKVTRVMCADGHFYRVVKA